MRPFLQDSFDPSTRFDDSYVVVAVSVVAAAAGRNELI